MKNIDFILNVVIFKLTSNIVYSSLEDEKEGEYIIFIFLKSVFWFKRWE